MHFWQQRKFEPEIAKRALSTYPPEPNNSIYVYDMIKAFKLT